MEATAEGDADDSVLDGFELFMDIGYTTDAFAARAVSFIERYRDRPFFVYLSFNAVHPPLEATQPYLDRFPGNQNEPRRTFAAMLAALDDGFGVVVERLRDLEIEDDALIC